jgi:hypothetical protein
VLCNWNFIVLVARIPTCLPVNSATIFLLVSEEEQHPGGSSSISLLSITQRRFDPSRFPLSGQEFPTRRWPIRSADFVDEILILITIFGFGTA